MTVREALRAGGQAIAGEDAAADAAWLVCAACGLARNALALAPGRTLTPEEEERYRAMLSRRVSGAPLQHVLGFVPFCGLHIACDPRALIPRPETEELALLARTLLPALPAGRALDLGTGTGALALALAAAGAGVDAVDISEAALSLARSNAQSLGLSGRVAFYLGSWYAPLPEGAYALILANPPYIPTADIEGLARVVRDREPRLALDGGPDGLQAYRAIAAGLPARLAPGGAVLCEAGAGQAPSVAALLAGRGLSVAIIDDMQGVPRIVRGDRPL